MSAKPGKKQILLVLLVAISSARAEPVKLLTEHLPPFQIVNDKKITGAATEIVRATFHEAGVDYQLEAYPWSISWQRAIREKNTCLYSLARLPSRESMMTWIGWLASLETHFYTSALSDVSAKNLEDVSRYKVAAIKDDASHHFLLDNGFVENKNLYVHQNYQTLLKLLDIKSRDIDLVIISETLFNYRVKEGYKKSRYRKLFRVDELTLEFYLACNPNTEESHIERLMTSLIELENSGTLSAIRKRWQVDLK